MLISTCTSPRCSAIGNSTCVLSPPSAAKGSRGSWQSYWPNETASFPIFLKGPAVYIIFSSQSMYTTFWLLGHNLSQSHTFFRATTVSVRSCVRRVFCISRCCTLLCPIKIICVILSKQANVAIFKSTMKFSCWIYAEFSITLIQTLEYLLRKTLKHSI